MLKRSAYIVCLLMVIAMVPACGRKGGQGQTEAQAIQDVVATAPDYVMMPGELEKHFVQGSIPQYEVLLKIAAATLVPAKPRISGETAFVNVTVREGGEKELGQVEWALVKDQSQWKIKAAPMP